jgi:hypothetical protein
MAGFAGDYTIAFSMFCWNMAIMKGNTHVLSPAGRDSIKSGHIDLHLASGGFTWQEQE